MKCLYQTRVHARRSANLICSTLIVLWIVSSQSAKAAPKTCESLADLALPNTKITSAQQVTSGEFILRGRTGSITGLPPFCRVAATLTPSTDSDIKIEVWL